MIVYNAIVGADQGGILGRPDTKVPQNENLYVVEGWIGPEGLLADASFASAKHIAQQILRVQPKAHPKLIPLISVVLGERFMFFSNKLYIELNMILPIGPTSVDIISTWQ